MSYCDTEFFFLCGSNELTYLQNSIFFKNSSMFKQPSIIPNTSHNEAYKALLGVHQHRTGQVLTTWQLKTTVIPITKFRPLCTSWCGLIITQHGETCQWLEEEKETVLKIGILWPEEQSGKHWSVAVLVWTAMLQSILQPTLMVLYNLHLFLKTVYLREENITSSLPVEGMNPIW